MSRTDRTFLLAAVLVLVGGGLAFWVLTPRSRPDAVTEAGDRVPVAVEEPTAGPEKVQAPEPETTSGPEGELSFPGRSGGLEPGLRKPSGEDLSDPAKVKELLRAQLSSPNPRWDWIADLLGVLAEPLEADLKAALQDALTKGNAAGAMQAYRKLRDGTVVPDLLKLLDDPSIDAHDRANLLVAITSIPGKDAAQTVTGIESRLTGDYEHDVIYLQAISRVGGIEGARALVDAISRSSDPSKFGPEVWRTLDLHQSPEASGVLAEALKSSTLSPAALQSVAALAGRTGASPSLVEALLALETPNQPEALRRQVMESLAATGTDGAMERLITIASAGADYASVAAQALGNITSASTAARERMLDTAKTTSDDFLRQKLVEGLGSVKAVTAVPYLNETVAGHGNELVRKEAVLSLMKVGPPARSAATYTALSTAYESGDEAMRGHVALALAEIGGDEAKRLLEQFRVAEKSPTVKRILDGAFRRLETKKSSP